MGGVELHSHTTASDGAYTPAELVAAAIDAELEAIAITDHDTVAGIAPAMEAAVGKGITVVPAIEVSCDVPRGECHVLGYLIDPDSPFLEEPLNFLRDRRRDRARRMVENLARLGVMISLPDRPDDSSYGRPHIAQALLDGGYVNTFQEAFHRYLATGAPAYEPSPRLRPDEAFDMILKAGGVPVLAHPHTFDEPALIRAYAREGLMGIEGAYASYRSAQKKRWRKLANELNLVVTGGTDFHGPMRPDRPLGLVRMDIGILDELRNKRRA